MYCVVLNCRKNPEKCPGLAFFNFPKEEERCRSWVFNCGRRDLTKISSSDMHKTHILCADHFVDSQFVDPTSKQELSQSAVPSLFTGPDVPQFYSVPMPFIQNQRSITTCEDGVPESLTNVTIDQSKMSNSVLDITRGDASIKTRKKKNITKPATTASVSQNAVLVQSNDGTASQSDCMVTSNSKKTANKTATSTSRCTSSKCIISKPALTRNTVYYRPILPKPPETDVASTVDGSTSSVNSTVSMLKHKQYRSGPVSSTSAYLPLSHLQRDKARSLNHVTSSSHIEQVDRKNSRTFTTKITRIPDSNSETATCTYLVKSQTAKKVLPKSHSEFVHKLDECVQQRRHLAAEPTLNEKTDLSSVIPAIMLPGEESAESIIDLHFMAKAQFLNTMSTLVAPKKTRRYMKQKLTDIKSNKLKKTYRNSNPALKNAKTNTLKETLVELQSKEGKTMHAILQVDPALVTPVAMENTSQERLPEITPEQSTPPVVTSSCASSSQLSDNPIQSAIKVEPENTHEEPLQKSELHKPTAFILNNTASLLSSETRFCDDVIAEDMDVKNESTDDTMLVTDTVKNCGILLQSFSKQSSKYGDGDVKEELSEDNVLDIDSLQNGARPVQYSARHSSEDSSTEKTVRSNSSPVFKVSGKTNTREKIRRTNKLRLKPLGTVRAVSVDKASGPRYHISKANRYVSYHMCHKDVIMFSMKLKLARQKRIIEKLRKEVRWLKTFAHL